MSTGPVPAHALAAAATVAIFTLVHALGSPLLMLDVSIEQLLQHSGDYVVEFESQFSNVVAEESYTQRYSMPSAARDTKTTLVRTLVSDFLLVKVPSQDTLIPFRDVLEVDGHLVRDRQERLTKLFLQPPATAIEQANAIMAESARYNLGPQRTANVPILGLLPLRPLNQPRFKFSHLVRDEEAGDDVWSIEFREQQRPTLIRSTKGANVVAHGRAWIVASTGAVVKTELSLDSRTVSVVMKTEYQHDPGLNLIVPTRMLETYHYSQDVEFVFGLARYSNLRRFTVQTDEQIKK